MGGLPSALIPVTLPNDLDLRPGEKADLWSYDAAPFPGVPGQWVNNGTGTVSGDGSKIVSDPGVGITRFCGVCGLSCFIPRQQGQPNRNPDGTTGGDPVDFNVGQMIVEKTDLVLPGRIPALIHRTYNPFDPFQNIAGFQLSLGPGWALSVEAVLQAETATLRRLILPGNSRFAFVQQPDGTFVNTTHPRFAGAVLTAGGSGGHQLRFKDGTVWRFAQSFIAGVGVLVEQTDRNGNHLTIERDGSSRITQIVEPSGRALVTTIASGRIKEIKDPLGRTVQYSYNSAGRLETVTDPAGGVTRYTYDGNARILTITDPRGITYLTNEYDASGRVARQTQADGGVWLFRYAGPTGAPVGVNVTDPRGNSTTQLLTAEGLARETIDAVGQHTRFERDASGQVVAVTDPLGRVTRFEYDAAGNVTKITDRANNVRLFEHEPTFNRLTKLIAPAPDGPPGDPGPVTTFEYDAKGNLITITDPEQNLKPVPERLKTRIAYNEFGQPQSVTDPLGNVTTFTYDVQGNLATVSDPLHHTSRRTYDLVSRLTAQTDPRGKTTRFAYDDLNRITQIFDALGGPTKFTYDENGNLRSVTDARNHATTYHHDNMDRLERRTDPLMASETFEYDNLGNLIRHTDRKQQTSTFTYDPLNRQVRADYRDATTTFVYDAVGRLVQASDSQGGDILESYDILDRLIGETTSLGTVAHIYDAIGRRATMSVAGQDLTHYSYDANSRLVQIAQGSQVVDFDYDVLGRRTGLTLPNGVSTEYQYDTASRLTQLIYRNTAEILGNLTYEYDPAGNRTHIGGSFARTLLPDPIVSASYDGANRQLRFGEKAMTFDANGNLVAGTDASGLTALTWDSRNRLGGIAGPSTTAAFTYDVFGRRTQRQLKGQPTSYLYDGVDIVREIAGGMQANLIRGQRIDEPLVRNSSEYYLTDALGSIIALTDPAGSLHVAYTYEPFGGTEVVGASSNPFQYTARENDGTGLYYYRARYYDPTGGRFLQEDPLPGLASRPQAQNQYSYVTNNPTNLSDAAGLLTIPLPGPLPGPLPEPPLPREPQPPAVNGGERGNMPPPSDSPSNPTSLQGCVGVEECPLVGLLPPLVLGQRKGGASSVQSGPTAIFGNEPGSTAIYRCKRSRRVLIRTFTVALPFPPSKILRRCDNGETIFASPVFDS